MRFKAVLAANVALLLVGCGIVSTQRIESMMPRERHDLLVGRSTEELCAALDHAFIQPKTKEDVERILIARGIRECVTSLGKRAIPSSDGAPPVAVTPAATSAATRNAQKPSSTSYLTAKADMTDPQTVTRAVRTSRDEFRGITLYEGPNASVDVTFDEDPLWALRLRAGKAKGGAARYQIYVKDSYVGTRWPDYNEAYDSRSARLALRRIDREVKNCTRECLFTEELAIDVSSEYLENARETGIRFRVYGSNRAREFLIPAGYVKGFLTAVQASTND